MSYSNQALYQNAAATRAHDAASATLPPQQPPAAPAAELGVMSYVTGLPQCTVYCKWYEIELNNLSTLNTHSVTSFLV